MTKKKTGLLIAIIAFLVLCAALAIFLLGKGDTASGEVTTYTVEVKTEGGMALSDIGVFVYANSKLEELVWVATTDEEGKVTFDAAKSSKYVAVLKDVPDGYEAEESYALKDVNTVIMLKTALLQEEDLTKITYELGDVIYDFSVTTPDGTVYTMSELLKEKKAVILNFWYIECGPCKTEFPFLQEAYEQFSDELIVLAMNPVNTDDAAIAEFQKSMGITFPMAQCSSDWEQTMQIKGYPTTVVIDRYGVISMIHSGAITNTESFVEIFEHYAAENYEQAVIEDMEEIVTYEEEEGSVGNAIELGGIDKFDATVKPGKVVYYDLYKVSGMNLQIKDADAYIIYGDKTYYPSNGVVSVKLTTPDTYTPATVGIGNAGDKEKTFHANLVFDGGTQGNPYSMSLGEFTTNVKAGNNQGVYYTYKSPKEGILTVQCLSATSGVEYDYVLYNLDSYAYRTLSSDNVKTDGLPTVTVSVKAGQTIQMIVNTLPNSSNEYPAGTFKFKAFFKEEKVEDTVVKDETLTYTITVKDENDKPMSLVEFKVKTPDGLVSYKTNASGIATIKLAKGTYEARLILPEGYISKSTQYHLTEKEPAISVSLELNMQDYKVTVVDTEGNPIVGATVLLEEVNQSSTTNEKGEVIFNLKKDKYSVIISAYGYFTEKTELTTEVPECQVEMEVDEMAGKAEYQVNVKDLYGVPLKEGVTVRFIQENETITAVPIDSNGVAKAILAEGNYSVEIASSGETEYVIANEVPKLSAENATVELQVVAKHDGTHTFIWDEYYVRILSDGYTYVELNPDATNYFMIAKGEQGLYGFTTVEGNAKLVEIGYIAAPPNWDEATYGLKWNLEESRIPDGDVSEYIFAVSGVENCILRVERLDDATDTTIKYTDYVAKTKPSQYTFSGGNLTYVDLTASTSDYKLVLGNDKYYHLGSATGPIMYVNLDYNKYVSFDDMINGFGAGGGTGFKYVSKDKSIAEDYTTCMIEYISFRDKTTNVYPLTEDLMYMIQKGGEYKGWWDSTDDDYLFEGVNLNQDLAWMFACCYVK